MEEQSEQPRIGWQIWATAAVIGVAAAATFVALRKRAKSLDVDTLIDACDRAADALEEVLYIPRRQAS